MKSVSKHITQSSECSYLNASGSSLTELFIVSGYWLSANGVSVRQKEKFWKPISLLCKILQDQVRQAVITPHELSFCMNFLLSTALGPNNQVLTVFVVQSLSDILHVLFYETKDTTLVGQVAPTIHKLCLALLTIHERSFRDFAHRIDAAMSRTSYNKKCSIGALAKMNDADRSWEEGYEQTISSESDTLAKIIKEKASDGEKTLSDIMVGAYDCLDTIVNSGKISLDEILCAGDVVNQDEAAQRRAFGDVNEKYEVEHLFSTIQHEGRNLVGECRHFLQIMDQYPITKSGNSADALARLLALRRLEKSIAAHNVSANDVVEVQLKVIKSLVNICQSNDSDNAKVVSSNCLGGLGSSWISICCDGSDTPKSQSYGDDPLQVMKVKALSMIGRFVLTGAPEIAPISMKTAKSLLASDDGKECWALLEDDQIKEVLRPFFVATSKQDTQKEQITLSKTYISKLKTLAGETCESVDWCWSGDLWSGFAYLDKKSTGGFWVKQIVSALISCCFGKDVKGPKCGFIRSCQGLCAKDAEFASCVFPAIVYFLLDSESGDDKYDKRSVRDMVMSDIAIGSSTGQLNTTITSCFRNILKLYNANSEELPSAQYAVGVILKTLNTLHSVTKQRFVSSSCHKKNPAVEIPKDFSSTGKKCRKSSSGRLKMPTRPNWRGVPYGVVLRLDGLEVARACLKSKQHHDAIYFW